MSDAKGLQGKTAFISGSGKNIGRAIAIELARRGSHIVLNGLSDRASCDAVAEEVRRLGSRALVVMGDVGSADTVAAIARASLDEFGTVDILVNNAAMRPQKRFLDVTDEDWFGVLDLNLHAAFYACRAFLPGMTSNGWGRIVNLTGMLSMQGYPNGAAISTAKHGLWGLTKALAKEFAPAGVTVNAISPGTIQTEGRTPSPEALSRIPVGRAGEPEDIASLAGYLCSHEASFITGQMIASNGGAQT